ncbi:hypothetical protein BAJUN_01330 [Bajunvirus bajun]|uniref:Uncharacterized protein n=1 Tax=Brevundimonas phage vB_BgoS-Bajun TaxID=2948594 RepID=A0A9E7SRL5_9CAUD|nr:hypothetical protein BAJUN_01330 [Brevundimonas phage vB_BgoS-Bajun]
MENPPLLESLKSALFAIVCFGAIFGLLVLWFRAGMRRDAARTEWIVAGEKLVDQMDRTITGPRYRIERAEGSATWTIYVRRHSRPYAPENFKRSTPPHAPVLEWGLADWSVSSEAKARARVKEFADQERARWAEPVVTCFDVYGGETDCGDTV